MCVRAYGILRRLNGVGWMDDILHVADWHFLHVLIHSTEQFLDFV